MDTTPWKKLQTHQHKTQHYLYSQLLLEGLLRWVMGVTVHTRETKRRRHQRNKEMFCLNQDRESSLGLPHSWWVPQLMSPQLIREQLVLPFFHENLWRTVFSSSSRRMPSLLNFSWHWILVLLPALVMCEHFRLPQAFILLQSPEILKSIKT